MPTTILRLALFFAIVTSPTSALAAEDYFGAGDGHHGAKVVAGDEVVNAYSALTADVSVDDTILQVADGTKFAAGDLVLVWQVNGHAVPASGDQTDIDLSTESVGTFEFARVESVSTNILLLLDPMVSAFPAANTQVVFVPEYTDVTVGETDSVQAMDWDPALGEGGIVAFLANGAVTLDGSVSANGAGFLGGTDRGNSGSNGCTGLDEPSPTGAEKGEGISGLDLLGGGPPGGTGRGNRANGGGGGVCHNSGGGGGGHGGLGGLGGRTWRGDPDPDIAGTGRDVGGMGGASMSYSALTHLVMGGGGGAGHQNNGVGGVGSDGGGVVFVRAGSVAGVGTFEADGLDGGDSTGSRNDAAGGAGAGGLVVVRVATEMLCSRASAAGGDGGSALTDDHGTGGGGAGGRILLMAASGNCPTFVPGGVPGVQTDLTEPPGENYGALSGESGDVEIGGPLVADTDGDGLLDVIEGSGDRDGDSRPDFLDADDDGDGVSTANESADFNGDGDPADASDDDSDGVPNYLDLDSDGDGIPDVLEVGGRDDDANGIAEDCALEPTASACEAIIESLNTDGTLIGGDSVPDRIELDSDADGIDDADEAFDLDGDGVADVTPSGNDHDGDGIDDAFDVDCVSAGDPVDCVTEGFALTPGNTADDDDDGVPNWRESCGDGYLTAAPSPEVCDDGDGDDANACNNSCRLNAGFGPCNDVSECASAPGIVCDAGTSLCQFPEGSGGSCTEENEATVCQDSVCDAVTGICVECADDLDCAAGERCAANACVLASCGDGVVDDGEVCDNGDDNGLAPEECATDCRLNVGAACSVDEDCTGDATCSDEGACEVPDPRINDSDGDGIPDSVGTLSVEGGGGFSGCHVGVARQGTPTSVSFLLLLALSLAIRRYSRP